MNLSKRKLTSLNFMKIKRGIKIKANEKAPIIIITEAPGQCIILKNDPKKVNIVESKPVK
jgi:hypothetical protein